MPLTKKPPTSDEESVDNDSPTDSEYESSTEMSEHDSSTDSEHETSTEMSVGEDESDTDFLNDDEFASYRKIFDSFMM